MEPLRSRKTFHTMALALATALFACGGGDDDPTDPGDPEPPTGEATVIDLTSSLTFSQADVTVSAGTTVRWVNQANITHTVTPDGHTEWTEWVTDTSGQSFEHTFDEVGVYAYYCEPHRADGMTGVIRVE